MTDGLIGLGLAAAIRTVPGLDATEGALRDVPLDRLALDPADLPAIRGEASPVDALDPLVVTPVGARFRILRGAASAFEAHAAGVAALPCLVVHLGRAVLGSDAETGREAAPRALPAPAAPEADGTRDDVEVTFAALRGRPRWAGREPALRSALAEVDFDAARVLAAGRTVAGDDPADAIADVVSEALLELSGGEDGGREDGGGEAPADGRGPEAPKAGKTGKSGKAGKAVAALAGTDASRRPGWGSHEATPLALELSSAAGVRLAPCTDTTAQIARGTSTAVEAMNKLGRLPREAALALVTGLARNASGAGGNVTTNLLDAGRKVLADDRALREAPDLADAIAGLDLDAVRADAKARQRTGECGYVVGALALAMSAALCGPRPGLAMAA